MFGQFDIQYECPHCFIQDVKPVGSFMGDKFTCTNCKKSIDTEAKEWQASLNKVFKAMRKQISD